MDQIRKASRERPLNITDSSTDSAEDVFDNEGKWKDGPQDWGADPSKDLENREFREVFERCLSSLPARLSDAFSLRELDGLSTKEICKILDISATNLWVMLYRARMSLRSCLEMNWFGMKKTRNQ